MAQEPIIFRDAVEELLFAHRNPSSVRLLSAVAQNALLRAIRLGHSTSAPGALFLTAADLLTRDAADRGIGPKELATWSQPQSEAHRSDLWRNRHPVDRQAGRTRAPEPYRRRRQGYA